MRGLHTDQRWVASDREVQVDYLLAQAGALFARQATGAGWPLVRLSPPQPIPLAGPQNPEPLAGPPLPAPFPLRVPDVGGRFFSAITEV